MRILMCLALVLALLLFAAPGFLDAKGEKKGKDGDKKEKDKDKDKKKGKGKGSLLEEEDEEEEKKPEPKTFAFKDYLLSMNVKDGRWWKHDKNYTADDEKYGVVLKLRFKLPKTDEAFDLIVNCQGFSHDKKLKFEDGTELGCQNYKGLADKFYSDDMLQWKEVKNVEKPKAIKLNREFKKVFRYSFTGLHPKGGSPLHKVNHLFKHKKKTYRLTVLYTTGSHKKERVRDEAKALLATLKSRKKKK
ncbi:MAG: hypothetical protein ACYTDY_06350 [Planctomycetota bacterium]|jgi:hypothetical protein